MWESGNARGAATASRVRFARALRTLGALQTRNLDGRRQRADRPSRNRAPEYRVAPNNIDAEQALLGAILVNNDAYYRVSDFLAARALLRGSAQAHLRDRDDADPGRQARDARSRSRPFWATRTSAGVTVSQYLARLAAEATTVINAEDYGRTIYDLAIRRSLIGIGEDLVNTAYDAPVETSPRDQIEETEQRLYELAETGKYDGGFQRFSEALTTAIDMAANAFKREGKLSGHRDRPHRSRPHDGRAAALRPDHHRRPPRHGQDGARHQHRLQHRQGLRVREAARRQPQDRQRRRRRLLLARDVGRAAGDPHHRRAVGRALLQDPPRRHPRGRVLQDHRRRPRHAGDAALHRRDRRPLDRAARRARAPAQAPARPRPARRRLPPAPLRLLEEGREPRAGS